MKDRATVRWGRRGDAKAFLRLLNSLAEFEGLEPPTPAARKRILEDIFQKRRIHLVLAQRGSEPVGYALLFYAFSSFLARPTLFLEDIFVLEQSRREGVGRRLFLWCVDEANRRGCGRMEWSVLNWNGSAMRFYEGLGARRLDEWSVYRLDSAGLTALRDGRR